MPIINSKNYGRMLLVIGATSKLGRSIGLEYPFLFPTREEFDLTWSLEKMALYLTEVTSLFPELEEIVLFAAYTNVSASNRNKDTVYQTNIRGVRYLVYLLETFFRGKIKLTYISSDYVFEGNYGNYKVDDTICPVPGNYYAFSKAVADQMVTAYPNHLVIRTSFCEEGPWPYPVAFDDQWTSRDTLRVIAPRIKKLIESGATGEFHVGTERKTVYDLAKKLDPRVEPISRLTVTDVYIPFDTSLVSND